MKKHIPADLVAHITSYVCGPDWIWYWSRVNGRMMRVPLFETLLSII